MTFSKHFCNGRLLLQAAVMMAPVFLLSGCGASQEDIYYYVTDEAAKLRSGVTTQTELTWQERIYQGMITVSDSLKGITPLVCVVSILIGILIISLVKKEQKLRQKALFVFILGVPAFMIFITYGSAFLANWFQ